MKVKIKGTVKEISEECGTGNSKLKLAILPISEYSLMDESDKQKIAVFKVSSNRTCRERIFWGVSYSRQISFEIDYALCPEILLDSSCVGKNIELVLDLSETIIGETKLSSKKNDANESSIMASVYSDADFVKQIKLVLVGFFA